MDVEMLQDYNNWIGKSPQQILDAVRKNGWAGVFSTTKFPRGLPIWAHRVRNYFNREPKFLMRLDEKESKFRLKRLSYTSKIREEGIKDSVVHSKALTDYVYLDENNTEWFQMSPGGTIYHFKEVSNGTLEAIAQDHLGQTFTPIFKLVSSDNTDGSCETIIHNLVQNKGIAQTIAENLNPLSPVGHLDYNIGLVNAFALVSSLVLQKPPRYKGSYNYAETVIKGIPNHEKFDVKPHEDSRYGAYENPDDPFSPLSSRRFPKYAKGEEGKKPPLAEQI